MLIHELSEAQQINKVLFAKIKAKSEQLQFSIEQNSVLKIDVHRDN